MMRLTKATMVVSSPESDTCSQCPDCGFDAVATFTLTALTAEGVMPYGVIRRCVRCWQESQ